jgi:hypothetical protein
MKAVVLDLFGDPVPDDREPGRPEHQATDEKRQKVMLLQMLGWTVERIAGALGVSTPTLRKHYLPQLKARHVARDRVRAAILMRLFDGVEGGKVPAMKELARYIDRAEAGVLDGAGSMRPKADKRGKKEKRADAARYAGADSDDWGELLEPDGLPN